MSALVWPGFLGGEARRAVPLAIPRPVFVAVPYRLREAGNAEANPGPAILTAWLYRLDGEEPTHAEVRLADGRTGFFAAAWIVPGARIVPLRPARATTTRRIA